MTVDYARTRRAERNRDAKAAALAAAVRRMGLTVDDLLPGAGHREEVWRRAGCKRAPSTEDTWEAVVQLLRTDEERAAAAAPAPPAARPCVYHSDRPGRFYLRGWRCDACRPGQTPVPPAGTTLADLRAARPAAAAVELDTQIEAAKSHDSSAAGRARIASQAHRKYGREASRA